MADVDTYVDEMIIKFVSGREPLSQTGTPTLQKVNGNGHCRASSISTRKTLNGWMQLKQNQAAYCVFDVRVK